MQLQLQALLVKELVASHPLTSPTPSELYGAPPPQDQRWAASSWNLGTS